MVLQHFGFGATFREWVKSFYNETSVSLLLNDCPGNPALDLPHLLLAFDDDFTRLLSSLDKAEQFLELVREYADAAGLRLNVTRTCIMTFSHHVSSLKLSELRDRSDFKVLTPWEMVKLLGILQGATITPEQRFNDVIKKVVLIQSIILPLIWYTASITNTPQATLKVLDVIIRIFVNTHDANAVKAIPGMFDKDWIYTSVSDGGLGLIPPKLFIHATHLKCLRDGIAATVSTSAEPRWMAPVLALFSVVFEPLGEGFDILYANMKGGQWSLLPQYWRSTLKLWADVHVWHGTTNWKNFAQVMPLWNNIHFTFGKAKTPLSGDYVDFNGTYATADLLRMLLDDDDFARLSSMTRLVNDTMRRINLIIPRDSPYNGPYRPSKIESA
ncbi:hypothetical protein C6341_g16618 [Phytophthora cactorum]|nr:hypothetical protein C6341_g16618 [Phytophthora cactorum]